MKVSLYLNNYLKLIADRAEELINIPMPPFDADIYKEYFDTGNRLAFERIYFARREYLTVFGLTAALWKDLEDAGFVAGKKRVRYLSMLLKVMEDILEEPTWVLPAHGTREHCEGRAVSIDLFAAETAGSLSEIIKLAKKHPDMDGSLKKEYEGLLCLIRKSVRDRIFNLFLSKRPCDWWESSAMNWCSVCLGNIGSAAAYLKEELTEGEYFEIFSRASDSMALYIGSMTGDGVCPEGVGYYKYGMEHFLRFYELLEGDADLRPFLDKLPDFKEAALFMQRVYLGGGRSVNFSDCELRNKTKAGMSAMLSHIYSEVRLSRDFEDKTEPDSLALDKELMETMGGEECHRWLGAYYDYRWVKSYGSGLLFEEKGRQAAFYFFRDSQWYVKKWRDGSSFYAKGGNNGESHNHNDVGSFAYILKGREIFCDLGIGEYTEKYFGKDRYGILCTSSRGHNLPAPDGNYQKDGAGYRADSFYGDEKGIKVSFGGAYGNYLIDRKVKFLEKESELKGFELTDRILGADFVWDIFCTKIEPFIKDNRVYLDAGTESVCMSFDGGLLSYSEEEHINHSGNPERIYLIAVKKQAANGECCFKISVSAEPKENLRDSAADGIRLNKYLGDCGICSRREADRLIESGRVTVNGKTAKMGMRITSDSRVCVDKKIIRPENENIVIAFNKPAGIECTSAETVKDNIIDYIGFEKRIYPVGRLDKNSTGLILLTNNGELANYIMKAANYHEKEYVVTVDKPVTGKFLKAMSGGIHLKEKRNGQIILDAVTRKCKVEKLKDRVFSIVLTQGLNRQIRRMCASLGYNVLALRRVRIMNICLGDLKEGQYRRLSDMEYKELIGGK